MGRLGIAELTLILIGVILYILPIIIGMNKKKNNDYCINKYFFRLDCCWMGSRFDIGYF